MSIEHWLAFVAASAILLAIPGPTILLVISYALGHGRRFAAATVAGVALGDFTAMTASMLGLGALLAASAAIFTVLKWIGAAYLIYLGIKLWRAPVADTAAAGEAQESDGSALRIFLHTYVVTALNPKSIIFFVAFLPQFLDTARPVFTQMLIFETTFHGAPDHPQAEGAARGQPHRRFADDRGRAAGARLEEGIRLTAGALKENNHI